MPHALSACYKVVNYSTGPFAETGRTGRQGHHLKAEVARKRLQLVGIGALCLACKHEEVMIPNMNDFIFICDNAYTLQELMIMEVDILTTLAGAPADAAPVSSEELVDDSSGSITMEGRATDPAMAAGSSLWHAPTRVLRSRGMHTCSPVGRPERYTALSCGRAVYCHRRAIPAV